MRLKNVWNDLFIHAPLCTTGSRCEICAEGFYGDPLGEYGPPRQCQPCQCYNRLDEIPENTCDPLTGECRRCPYLSTGPRCEDCVEGYFHRYPSEPCQGTEHYLTNIILNIIQQTLTVQYKIIYLLFFCVLCIACDCNLKGSVSDSCSNNGQCKCREGYEGLKCEKSTCPSCFNPVKSQVRQCD